MKKKQKKETKKWDMSKVSKDKTDIADDAHDRAIKKLDALKEFEKLDEYNPLEQAMMFDTVKKHPPKPGFLEVKADIAETNDGNIVVVTESKQEGNKIKKIIYSRFHVLDLFSYLQAHIAKCPMYVAPMIYDMGQKLINEEKLAFKPETRKELFNWWWLVFLALVGIPAGFLAFTLIGSMLGG